MASTSEQAVDGNHKLRRAARLTGKGPNPFIGPKKAYTKTERHYNRDTTKKSAPEDRKFVGTNVRRSRVYNFKENAGKANADAYYQRCGRQRLAALVEQAQPILDGLRALPPSQQQQDDLLDRAAVTLAAAKDLLAEPRTAAALPAPHPAPLALSTPTVPMVAPGPAGASLPYPLNAWDLAAQACKAVAASQAPLRVRPANPATSKPPPSKRAGNTP